MQRGGRRRHRPAVHRRREGPAASRRPASRARPSSAARASRTRGSSGSRRSTTRRSRSPSSSSAAGGEGSGRRPLAGEPMERYFELYGRPEPGRRGRLPAWPTPPTPEPATARPRPRRRVGRRPLIERLGLAASRSSSARCSRSSAVASFVGGEPFLGVMGLIGCLMVLWVGGADPVPRLTDPDDEDRTNRARATAQIGRFLRRGNRFAIRRPDRREPDPRLGRTLVEEAATSPRPDPVARRHR